MSHLNFVGGRGEYFQFMTIYCVTTLVILRFYPSITCLWCKRGQIISLRYGQHVCKYSNLSVIRKYIYTKEIWPHRFVCKYRISSCSFNVSYLIIMFWLVGFIRLYHFLIGSALHNQIEKIRKKDLLCLSSGLTNPPPELSSPSSFRFQGVPWGSPSRTFLALETLSKNLFKVLYILARLAFPDYLANSVKKS